MQPPIALTGNLSISSAAEKSMLASLTQQLSTSLIDNDISAVKGISFTHETAGALENIATTASAGEAASVVSSATKLTHRVFVRDTPLRDAQLKNFSSIMGSGCSHR